MDQAATKAEAELRIRRALAHIQRAQDELGRAQTEISNLYGVLPSYRGLARMYEQVRREWYRLSDKRGSPKVDLDSIAVQSMQERGAL